MKANRVTIVLRSILGLIFVAGPLASALHLAPEPKLPPSAGALTSALAATGYMLPLLWSVEIASGVLVLLGLAVPLALAMLAPVIVNIAAFHTFLAPGAIAPAVVVSSLEVFLAWQYREAFRPLFTTVLSQAASEAPHSHHLAGQGEGGETAKVRVRAA